MDERPDLFQRMFESADLAHMSTIGGWTRKVQELEQHVSRGGKVNEGGSFFVQCSRKADMRIDHVIDFFACLPAKPKGSALVIALYCSPPMLDEYPAIIAELAKHGVYEQGEGWTWPRSARGAAGRYCSVFWSAWVQRSRKRYPAA